MKRVDTSARAEVREIAHGEPFSGDTDSKVAFYGYLARVMLNSSLQKIESREAPASFGQLHSLISDRLTLKIMPTHQKQTKLERDLMEDLAYEHLTRFMVIPDSYVDRITRQRIGAGIVTAADMEVVTLRTIADRQKHGSTTSLEGLYKSKRVPFSLAMMHLKEFTWMENIIEGSARGYESNAVLRTDVTTIDHDSGLSLTALPTSGSYVSGSTASGPAIGCPVTFVEGAIESLHYFAVDAALRGGLIRAS